MVGFLSKIKIPVIRPLFGFLYPSYVTYNILTIRILSFCVMDNASATGNRIGLPL